MSPTEDELRSALHDCAGDVPDVEHIVFAATERRVQRRRLTLAVASAVIVVGVLGAGGTYLVQRGSPAQSSGSSGTASSGGGGFAANAAGAPAAGAANGSARGATSSPSTTCPSNVPTHVNADVRGNGSGGMLFAEPVDTVSVCAYPTYVGSAGDPAHVELTGSDAATLVASLENASKQVSRAMCQDLRRTDQATIAVIATTASGKRLPVVTATINEPACAVVVTNGAAVRYGWSWPTSLSSQLSQLGGGTSARISGSSTPPGRIDGSPAQRPTGS